MSCARFALRFSVAFVWFTAIAQADESLPADTVQRLKDAAVYVKTEIGPIHFTGSGFVMQVTDNSALIVTNQHVISKPKELSLGSYIPGLRGRDRITLIRLQAALASTEPVVTVVFGSGTSNQQAIKAEILGALEDPDLAILKVSGIKSTPKPIEFRKSPPPVETMGVFILGFPFGDMLATDNENPTITIGKGSVSSIRKDASEKITKVQIDGAINPGNSGGPVVDAKGNLIGVAVQTIQGSNIGIAIPPADLINLLEGQVGQPAVVAGKAENGVAAKYFIEVPVIDPLKKLKVVSVQFVEGAVSFDKQPVGGSQSKSLDNAKTVKLTVENRVARGVLPISKSADKSERQITAQASYKNEHDRTVYGVPIVLKVAEPAAVTVTTKTEGGTTTTITQSQKSSGGTVQREITITRGSGGGGKAFEGARRLQNYPIKIAIPKTAEKVTEETPLEVGTKLGCCWGTRWYEVSILEINDDGSVKIHWSEFGDAWNGDISRDCLIIDKKVLAKLTKSAKKDTSVAKKSTNAKEADKDSATKETPVKKESKDSGDGTCELVLSGTGKNKFAVIKVVMDITGLNLKDTKELVENVPISIKQEITQDEAETLQKKITEAGGTADIKSP